MKYQLNNFQFCNTYYLPTVSGNLLTAICHCTQRRMWLKRWCTGSILLLVGKEGINDSLLYMRSGRKPQKELSIAANQKPKHAKFTMPSGTNTNPGYENPCLSGRKECCPKNNPPKRLVLIIWKLQVRFCKLG
ncbi:MAG: hypothetical protein FD181_3855 [Prolixibacteraceae bacterium]|nr:MAG: hypothetical protein FD181_3855 [Prolixibacteraceae bacterium]